MEERTELIPKTFLWMFFGLLVTGVTAVYTYTSGLFVDIVINNGFSLLLILELVVVILFSFLFRKLPPVIVEILYFVYAILNGVTTSVIFAVFEMESIIMVLFASAGLFAVLALYGYKTKKDLSNWHTVLYGVLLVGLILSIINLFLGNSMLEIVLNWVILITFFGITIYDMNKIKQLQYDDTIDPNKTHIYAAMDLYLDFINIFLRLLALFGKRRD